MAQPVLRPGLCSLAQPSIRQPLHTPVFRFDQASLILLRSGCIDIDDGEARLHVATAPGLLLLDPGTVADVRKTPAGPEPRFESLFLSFAPEIVLAAPQGRQSSAPSRVLELDADLEDSLRHVIKSVTQTSDARLRLRLLDLLTALAERGQFYRPHEGIGARLRHLLAQRPEQPWTARDAGRALAVSEATLRRRLAASEQRFDELLADVRMHHAMMLLQTTSWTLPHIAQACGYQSRARFSERFRSRFGFLPSAVR